MKIAVVAATLLLLLSCVFGTKWVALELQTNVAAEQVHVFCECRRKALLLAAEDEVRDLLQYVRTYYPSGSKLRTGSALDALVEDVRLLAITDMNARLEVLTSKNGDTKAGDGAEASKVRP